MRTSLKGRQFIEKYEGLRLKAYDDGTGVLTIGYGHTSSAGLPKVYVGQRITKEQADEFLMSDLTSVEKQIGNLVKVPLNQNQFDAIVSFQFNTGALGKSAALRMLNRKDYAGFANALLMYNHARGKAMLGLTRRRQDERALFLRKSVAVPGGTAVVVGGAAAAIASAPHHYWPWIAGATSLALLIGLGIYIYKRNKQ